MRMRTPTIHRLSSLILVQGKTEALSFAFGFVTLEAIKSGCAVPCVVFVAAVHA